MSAWSIGAERVRAGVLGRKPTAEEFVGRLTRWIPGDVLVLFASAINWVSAEPKPPSRSLLIVFLLATPIVVLLGAYSKRGVVPYDWVNALLATFAFAIWSISIPRSGWQAWPLFSSNPGWVTLASALGGLVFGLIASGIELRYGSGNYKAGG